MNVTLSVEADSPAVVVVVLADNYCLPVSQHPPGDCEAARGSDGFAGAVGAAPLPRADGHTVQTSVCQYVRKAAREQTGSKQVKVSNGRFLTQPVETRGVGVVGSSSNQGQRLWYGRIRGRGPCSRRSETAAPSV